MQEKVGKKLGKGELKLQKLRRTKPGQFKRAHVNFCEFGIYIQSI